MGNKEMLTQFAAIVCLALGAFISIRRPHAPMLTCPGMYLMAFGFGIAIAVFILNGLRIPIY